MRAALSVVIPTLNAERRLAATLGALFEGLEAGIIRELVISDGGSGDGTARIADEAGAVILIGSASRGGQLRRGTSLAGDFDQPAHQRRIRQIDGFNQQFLTGLNTAAVMQQHLSQPFNTRIFHGEFRGAASKSPGKVCGTMKSIDF